MGDIQLHLNDKGHGAFVLTEKEEVVAEMEVGIEAGKLTVYHTEVAENIKGQGIGKKLFDAMTVYSRERQLTVIALCPFVYAQFKKNPTQYADIWDQIRH